MNAALIADGASSWPSSQEETQIAWPTRSTLIGGMMPAMSLTQTRGLPGRFRSITGSTCHRPGSVLTSFSMTRMSDAVRVLLRCMVAAPFILGDDSDGPDQKEKANYCHRAQECVPGRNAPGMCIAADRIRGFGCLRKSYEIDIADVRHARTSRRCRQHSCWDTWVRVTLVYRLDYMPRHGGQVRRAYRKSTPY